MHEKIDFRPMRSIKFHFGSFITLLLLRSVSGVCVFVCCSVLSILPLQFRVRSVRLWLPFRWEQKWQISKLLLNSKLGGVQECFCLPEKCTTAACVRNVRACAIVLQTVCHCASCGELDGYTHTLDIYLLMLEIIVSLLC